MFGFAQVVVVIVSAFVEVATAAELTIFIPCSEENIEYLLDYHPPIGNPPPNIIINASTETGYVRIFEALPGTKYEFWLYYSNATHKEIQFSTNYTTVPDPPSELSVFVKSGKQAILSWSPPSQGSYKNFKLQINPLVHNITDELPTIIDNISHTEYTLEDLIPGASYQVQAFSVFENRDSVSYISRNFTTIPSTPQKFTLWFRNETSLVLMRQPPYPAGIFTHYKVSIDPPDANIEYIQNKEPHYSRKAAFKGLFPGRRYNITVQTLSEGELSVPNTAQYQTLPWRPRNVTFGKIDSSSFVVQWEPPAEKSQFDSYQVNIVTLKETVIIPKGEKTEWEFRDHLEPGKTYIVAVKSVSGKLTSWPVTNEVTLEHLSD